MRVTDGPNLYVQYKDEFLHRIYDFEAEGQEPRIIDGGGNHGMSVLFFKRRYPRCRITVFEPDPEVFALLQDNVRVNGWTDVDLRNAGLGAHEGRFHFRPDGTAGGQIEPEPTADGVFVERLSTYLSGSVDFLKLNIEGLEFAVLQEAAHADVLRNVREMVVEYHGWPHGPQQLGDLLNLLARQGFRYLVHDFDNQTCPQTKPPFCLRNDRPWFCLVYAIRMDARAGQPT